MLHNTMFIMSEKEDDRWLFMNEYLNTSDIM